MSKVHRGRNLGLALLMAAAAVGCSDAAALAGGDAEAEAAASTAAGAEVATASTDHTAHPAPAESPSAAAAAASSPSEAVQAVGDAPVIHVYATPTCGCCKAWMDHMATNGFTVEVTYMDDLTPIRREKGVPAAVTSCHMGVVDGYVVEGHVPADVVARMLRERPETQGLAVPGMPAGSPGMEMPNGMVQPYEVYTFDATGPKSVYEYRN